MDPESPRSAPPEPSVVRSAMLKRRRDDIYWIIVTKEGGAVDFRHLHYFLTLAEERNFRRAAHKLGISQPPLSQLIRRLEQEYGHQLFIRHARDVELTDAGRILFGGARSVLALARETRQQIGKAGQGEIGELAISFTPGISFHPLIPALVRIWRQELPEIELTMRQAPTDELCAALLSGADDIALIRPSIEAPSTLTVKILEEEEMRIALPPGHRLRHAEQVGLADLADEAFVLWPRFLAPGLYDAIIQRCFSVGFTPRIRIEAPEKSTAIAFVAAGLGATLTPVSLSQIHPSEVAYRPIADAPFSAPIAIATRRGERNPVIHRFLKLTHRLAET